MNEQDRQQRQRSLDALIREVYAPPRTPEQARENPSDRDNAPLRSHDHVHPAERKHDISR